MRRLVIVTVLGAVLGVPAPTQAWVSYCRGGWGHVSYGHVGWGGATWHRGWGCGGVSTGTAVAAGLGGFAAGAMIGAAASRPVVVAPAPVVYAPPPVVVAPAVPIGSIYYSLPYGAQSANINGVQYYIANGVYYRPYFGSNGVYYQVASNPL